MKNKDDNKERRVLKIDINKNNPEFIIFDEYCLKAKNIYNSTTYYIKNFYIATKLLNEGKTPHENSIKVMNELRNWIEDYNNRIHKNNIDIIKKNVAIGIDDIELDTNDKNYGSLINKYNKEVEKLNKNKKKGDATIKKPQCMLNTKKQWGGEFVGFEILDKYMKQLDCFKALNSDTSSSIIKATVSVWKGYFESLAAYIKDKSKFKGRPQQPGYQDSNVGRYIFTCRRCCSIEKINDKYSLLKLDKADFKNSALSYKIPLPKNTNIAQIRIKPSSIKMTLEIIYVIENPIMKKDNGRTVAVDIGINRLATTCNTIGVRPMAINGLPLKSMNKHWNKEISKYKSILKKTNDLWTSKKYQLMNNYRNNYMNTYLHKASTLLVEWCEDNDITKVIIGKNKGWKDECDMGNETQTFVQIPFARFIEMIEYKCKTKGITAIVQEESYTSKSSFIDNDYIATYGKDDDKSVRSGYRNNRGMYITKEGIKIHADLNGAYNILRKYDSKFIYNNNFLHPYIVNVG